ncbi:hypothetical protein [Caulobacter sp. 17J65-9]|uniref:hypothetical protein n=1 Tax=Caulobacter sp. 17J65-9 TaxID=2709382 RepID=UPI0013CA4620|nr:hypothetical protein [Caulobacter sp. 17J65-9]NEX94700.1 hypothetical protein [Caulobacter sp. 17J65-9]
MLAFLGFTILGGAAVTWGMAGFARAGSGAKLLRLLAILVGLLMLAGSAFMFATLARMISPPHAYTYEDAPRP